MPSIKLTVNRLYQWRAGEKHPVRAVARVYAGEVLVATEEITGMTEEPVSKYLHHNLPEGQHVHIEWDCMGEAIMTADEVQVCPCCHPQAND